MGEDVGRALPEQKGGAARAQSGSGVGARGGLTDPPPEGARSLSLSVGLGGCRAQGRLAGEAGALHLPTQHPGKRTSGPWKQNAPQTRPLYTQGRDAMSPFEISVLDNFKTEI